MTGDDGPGAAFGRGGRTHETTRSRGAGGIQTDLVIAIAAGGVFGAAARYGMSTLFGHADRASPQPGGFPWATFVENVLGCLLLGALLVAFSELVPAARRLRAVVATGVLGAFTTFSTFAVETMLLAADGAAGTAAVYAVSTLAAGLAAASLGVTAGWMCVRRIAGRQR